MTVARITVVGWDHPRCSGPLRAAAAAWSGRTGVAVDVGLRSLDAFNDQPLAELVPRYDLVVLDHPMVPAAAEAGLLRAFEDLLDEDSLRAIAAGSVGPSAASYRFAERTWALAMDAACHVAAWRPDRLTQLGVAADEPLRWEAVLDLARRVPGSVAVPLRPADATCALLSVAASYGTPLRIGCPVPPAAVRTLATLALLVHPDSWRCGPPQVLDALDADAAYCLVPLTFGYRRPPGSRMYYGSVPSSNAPPAGVLGGAGLGVSSAAAHPEVAAKFAAWLCSGPAQRDVVLAAGGQPAHRAAYGFGAESGTRFLAQTRPALETAHVRPADPCWPALHHRIGVLLHDALRAQESVPELTEHLDRMLVAA